MLPMKLLEPRPAALRRRRDGIASFEKRTDHQANQIPADAGERLGRARLGRRRRSRAPRPDLQRRRAARERAGLDGASGTAMSDPEETRQIVVFALGEEEYALTIGDVQEIIRYLEPRTVASDAPWILGVISLRGRIIPVCDLALRLGVQRSAGAAAKIIVVEAGEHIVGLVVDDVTEVLTLDESDIEELHVATAGGVQSVAKVGERLIVLLASESIFEQSELADAV
jgi:purine-binding chemotaxis protein CheW